MTIREFVAGFSPEGKIPKRVPTEILDVVFRDLPKDKQLLVAGIEKECFYARQRTSAALEQATTALRDTPGAASLADVPNGDLLNQEVSEAVVREDALYILV
jgi:hypothetical protein